MLAGVLIIGYRVAWEVWYRRSRRRSSTRWVNHIGLGGFGFAFIAAGLGLSVLAGGLLLVAVAFSLVTLITILFRSPTRVGQAGTDAELPDRSGQV